MCFHHQTQKWFLLGTLIFPNSTGTPTVPPLIYSERYFIIRYYTRQFLFQLVKDPSRNGNILDMVFVTSLGIVYDKKVGLPFSDHNSISMLLSRKSFFGRKSQKLSYHLRGQTGIISGIFYITLHGIVLLWILT